LILEFMFCWEVVVGQRGYAIALAIAMLLEAQV